MADGEVALRMPHGDKARRRRIRRRLLIGVPLLAVLALLLLWLGGGRTVSTDNATIQADLVTIAALVPGPVAAVAVHENQPVKAGDELFRIEDQPYRLAVDRARANLDEIRVELEALQATWGQRRFEIDQAESDLNFARQQLDRESELARRGVAARAQLDQARRNSASAEARLAALHQAADAVRAQLGGDPDHPIEDHPRYQDALAALNRAEYDLGQTVVRAPFDGVATNVAQLQPGEVMQAGSPAFTLVGGQLWVAANPKETDLTYVAPGQPAEVRVDTYPGRVWRATVGSVSPATAAQFSVLPPQNATGNWVKVVQRVPVRLEIQLPPDAPPLSAGMSVVVEIRTGHRRHLSDLLTLF